MYSAVAPTEMGLTDLVTHTTDTGEHRFIRLPLRRLLINKQEGECSEVQKLLDRGIIEPCQSSWTSPVVLVTKKDGFTRLCVDYQKVNDITHKDSYPLPRIDDTLDGLRVSQYFSTLDLYSWQVNMDPKDIDKMTFVTHQGLFRFTVLPFGLCNSPALFELVLTALHWKICFIYLADVIIHGGNFYDTLDRLKLAWKHIQEVPLKLKPSK